MSRFCGPELQQSRWSATGVNLVDAFGEAQRGSPAQRKGKAFDQRPQRPSPRGRSWGDW